MGAWTREKLLSYLNSLIDLYGDNEYRVLRLYEVKELSGRGLKKDSEDFEEYDAINKGIFNSLNNELKNTREKLAQLMNCTEDRVIFTALGDPKLSNLAMHLLYFPELGLPINPTDSSEDESTVFIEVCNKIIEENSLLEAKEVLTQLFNYDLKLTDKDESYIKDIYKRGLGDPRQEQLWTIMRTYMKLDTADEFRVAVESVNLSTITTITTIKTDIVFAKRFNSILAYLNYALKEYKPNAILIMKAIDLNVAKNPFLKEATQAKTYKNIRQEIVAEQPPQNEEFANILKKIFPELAQAS